MSDLNPLLEPLQAKYAATPPPVRERPWHRLATGMAAQGFNQEEIATAVGRDRKTVYRVVNQPEQQERALRIVATTVADELKQMIESVAQGSIVRLKDMAEDVSLKETHPKLYADVNQSFIDRYLGKAPVVVEQRATDPNALSDTDLASNIAKLREEVGTTQEPRS